MSIDDTGFAGAFEERAEYLTREQLRSLVVETPSDAKILKKLTGPGAKLLTGPRGCGKSTHMRRAYYQLIEGRSAFPVYVNYAKALAIEPLFHKAPNAHEIFRQWLLLKVLVGAQKTLEESEVPVPASLQHTFGRARQTLHEVARTGVTELDLAVSPAEVAEMLVACTEPFGGHRVVLLLDDAAHAFSLQQQQTFFEVFRELRTHRIAPKAAVYPGVTSYSPFFHVGHEAELVEAWLDVAHPAYVDTMKDILRTRLPDVLRQRIFAKEDLLELVIFASFGIPRGLLNIVSQALDVDSVEQSGAPTRSDVLGAITAYRDSTMQVFEAISLKLPRYARFVEVGSTLVAAATQALAEFNDGRSVESKSVTLALPHPPPAELAKVLQFLEYAGVLRPGATVSRGVKGVFQRLVLHHSFIIKDNALALGRSFSVATVVEALSTRDPHAFVRRTPASLLGEDWATRCQLLLPPCTNCGAPRIAEDQRFCMRCGTEMSTASVYSDLLKAPLSNLPITTSRAQTIVQNSTLRTVQDIIADDQGQLRQVPQVGPVWHARIKTFADEFVSV